MEQWCDFDRPIIYTKASNAINLELIILPAFFRVQKEEAIKRLKDRYNGETLDLSRAREEVVIDQDNHEAANTAAAMKVEDSNDE